MKLSLLRKIIREEIINTWQHNVATRNNEPYSYEDYPEIDIETYPSGGGYHAKVTVKFDDSLSTPLRVFRTEEEAKNFVRKHAEIAHRSHLALEQ